MIITVVCDVLGEENNGTTIAAMNLIRFLKSRGHDVRVVCADKNRAGEEGYYVVPNINFGKYLNDFIKKVGVTIAKPQDDVIVRALEGTDHVHVMLPFFLGKRATELAKERNLTVTAGFHMQAENFTSYIKLGKFKPLNKKVYKIIYKYVYQYVDAVHYPTEFIKNIFEKNVKKKTNGYVISNGVHDYVQRRESAKPDQYVDKFVILSTGRYAKEKAQDVLIKAVCCSAYKDKIQLILGGQGVKQKKYKKLATKLPVQPVFKFYSRTEIIDVLNYADMYVHPAEMELEGIACLEAITCGKLTVVSDSKLSATREFAVDEKCVFKKGNPKDLARVIDYWIANAEERKEYEQKYLKKAVVFRQEDCMLKMEHMIKEVAKRKNA